MNEFLAPTSIDALDLIMTPDKIIPVPRVLCDEALSRLMMTASELQPVDFLIRGPRLRKPIRVSNEDTITINSTSTEIEIQSIPHITMHGHSISIRCDQGRYILPSNGRYTITQLTGLNSEDLITSVINHDIAVNRPWLPTQIKSYCSLPQEQMDDVFIDLDDIWLHVSSILNRYPTHIVKVDMSSGILAVKIFCDIRTYLWTMDNMVDE